MLATGIVGLPNVGKSTLFNAITQAGAEAANYPFCTIDPNVGVVEVPDPRLDKLAKMVKPQRVLPTAFEFVDIAGLVKGASEGEGLGNQFLAHIREVDAIVHVVRCFVDENVTHVSGAADPIADIGVVNAELILADLATVERRLERVKRQMKTGEKRYVIEKQLLERVANALGEETFARRLTYTDEEAAVLNELHLLTMKPVLYVANVGEDDMGKEWDNEYVRTVKRLAEQEGTEVVPLCGKVEAELAELDGEDKQLFLEGLGLEEPGLNRLIRAAYRLLGLITYFTAGEKEVRAWTVEAGTKAPQAAGVIHSDFERGFIRAEVVAYDALVKAGSMVQAREQGLIRLEGKDYVVQDGDVIHFRFNV